MSLSYSQMLQLLAEIQPSLENAVCQTAGTTVTNALILEFHTPSAKSIHLLISVKTPFQRFHLTNKPIYPPSQTHFFKVLIKECVGKKIQKCSLLNNDKILSLEFENNIQLVAELIPRRPNCYLLDSSSRILASWNPSKSISYQPPPKPDGTKNPSQDSRHIDSLSIDKEYEKQELTALFSHQKQALLKQLQLHVNRTEKTVHQRQQTLSDCQQWEQSHHLGVLLQSQLYRLHKGIKEITVNDWNNEDKPQTIALDPLLEPYQQVEIFFKRSKKLRLGIPHAERMLQQAQQEHLKRHHQLTLLEKVHSLDELQAFCHTHHIVFKTSTQAPPVSRKKEEPTKPYSIYALAQGIYAWVGKSAKDNDKLSFQHANGSDWWLHVRDYPGSHIVVRCAKNQTIEGEALKDACELALRFSKAKHVKTGEVVLTQPKYLTRIKNTPGKVQLSKHKVLQHSLDEQRWQRLKNSKQKQ